MFPTSAPVSAHSFAGTLNDLKDFFKCSIKVCFNRSSPYFMVLPAPFPCVTSFSFPFKHLAINLQHVYFAAVEVGGKDFTSSTLLLTSTFLQNVLYPKLLRVPF